MAAFPGWKLALLRAIGAPPSPANLQALGVWQQSEGGAAAFNPLNTTQRAPGAGSYNSVGVRSYRGPQQGVQATAQTLLNGRYAPVVQSLRKSAPAAQTLSAVGASPWGTSSGLLQRVLGSPLPAGGAQSAAGAGPVPPTAPAPAPNLLPARAALAQNLIAASQATSRGERPDYSQTFQLVATLKSPPQAPNQRARPIQVVAQPGVSPGKAQQVVQLAQKFLGTKYVWGGSRPGGFDCSGLLQYVWGQRGVKIPRTSQQQFKAGVPVAKSQLRPGDAVFFEGAAPGHVGLYIGGGRFVESPHTGAVVRISNLAGRADYVGARRFV